jgi:transcription antitermination protein NusB
MDITGENGAGGLAKVCEHLCPGQGEDEFSQRLVRGVLDHGPEIDRVIEGHSENWRLERMPAVDRNILRIAAFELLYCEEIPPKVAVNEAVELGKRFGTEESGSFINGILDKIMSSVSRPQPASK